MKRFLITVAHGLPHPRRRCTRTGPTCTQIAGQMARESRPWRDIVDMAGAERGWRVRGSGIVAAATGAGLAVALGAGGCGPPANHTPDFPPPANTGQPVNPQGPSPVGSSGLTQ